MKDNMYALLNDMDVQVESYEPSDVTPKEMKCWKKAFRMKCNKEKSKKKYIGRYVAVAAVLLFAILAIGPFQRETYAQIKTITYNVQEMLGMETNLSGYETVVGETIVKDGVTITVNDVVMDRNEMVVSYTVTAEKLDDTTMNCYLDVEVNGKSVYGGSTGTCWMEDDNNMVALDNVILSDVDIEQKNYYKLVFYTYEEKPDEEVVSIFDVSKVGAVEFAASGEQLAIETITIPLEEQCEFPNDDTINFTKFSYNTMGPRLYFELGNGNLDYDVWLKGIDDLGNEIYFYLSHIGGDGECWFVLAEDTGYDFSADASQLTLQVYAVEMPEQNGEIGNDYQSIGEPFTIELK